MEDSLPKIRSKHIFRVEAGVIQCRLVGVDRRAGRVQHDNRLRYGVGNSTKFTFIFPQLLFCLFESIDICACSVPPDELAGLVAERLNANEKPTKDTVVAAKTCLDLAGFTCDQ